MASRVCQPRLYEILMCIAVANLTGTLSADELTIEKVSTVVLKYCIDCHSDDHSEAEINFRSMLSDRPFVRHRKRWLRASHLVTLHSMPPADADQPTERERQQLARWISKLVDEFDYATIEDPGFEPARRLNHREYNNTLRDLLGVDLQPADRFPRDLVGKTGFDTSSGALSLQPALMERYIASAERVVDAALPLTGVGTIEPEVKLHLFGQLSPDQLDDARAEKIIRRFVWRAYRQPPRRVDVDRAFAAYRQSRTDGQSHYAAIRATLPGVLVSPSFLYRVELPESMDSSGRISDWSLATRLSYFLWSSMPDDRLFKLASSGQLQEPETLAAEVVRMLNDSRSDAFVRSFVGQWLSTNLIGYEIRRDPIDEPWCTDSLMDAMREEPELLFAAIVRENRPLTDLVEADFTFVNEELATTLYEISSVQGSRMQRISLAGTPRRGLLGQAAVLAVTSNYDETSPIKRGAYILDVLLGSPPPEPPPDVGELSDELQENDRLSFAQKLSRHADDPRCAACHQAIDPLGIALEGFGAFGRQRSNVDGRSVIRGATLLDGTRVADLRGLNDYLLGDRRDEFIRNITVKMLEYALGRPIEYYDELAVRTIIASLEKDELKMQSLIQAIVASYPFQYQRTERGS